MNQPAVIHRAELPLDDRPHAIDLTGEILHVAARRPLAVDVWYQTRPDSVQPMRRSFQIVGTGQPIPTHLGVDTIGRHHGTAVNREADLVWHVLENFCLHEEVIDTAELDRQPGYGSGICPRCAVALRGDGNDGWIPA
ncbi:hypothetical protein [Streptomyces sp. NPDC018584]|uniref:DUF7352 domain-containing protein n=1 Tax=unclassified Streptomyces TaxID=2593676 RepID=UPI00379FD96C